MAVKTSKIPEKVDSKFRFVLLAARRAEQLMQGARPRLESFQDKKYTRIAQEEVRTDLVPWDYIVDEPPEPEALEVEAEAETEAETAAEGATEPEAGAEAEDASASSGDSEDKEEVH